MNTITLAPGANQGGILAAQCSLLRQDVEDAAIERTGFPLHIIPMPGAAFYQLAAKTFSVTYMILDEKVYCYESFDYSWRPMPVPPSHIRSATQLIKRIA